MPVENYKPLSCGSFGFLSLVAKADPQKNKRGGARANSGGYRPGAGRKPIEGSKFYFVGPKRPKFCKTCNVAFFGRGSGCDDHKGGKCTHEKPLFSNGKQRLACFSCAPKPEKKQKKSYEYKGKENSSCTCCGVIFEKTQYHNKYCSTACRNSYCNLAASKRKCNLSERPCRSCGVFFVPEFGEKNKLSCSQECREKFHSDARNEAVKKKMAPDPVYKFARNVRTFLHQSFL